MKLERCVLGFTSLLFLLCVYNPGLTQAQPQESVIAVADFQNNTGRKDYDKYIKGISESVSTALAKSGMLKIVERNRLQVAFREIALGLGDFVDEKTAARAGKIVGATSIIIGSFLVEKNVFLINARIIDVETSKVLAAEQAREKDIYQTIDNLSIRLLRRLGIEVFETTRYKLKRTGKWAFLTLGVGSGIGAEVMHKQAEDTYDKYLNTVDEEQMQKYYDDSLEKDRKRNLLIGVSGVALATSIYLYLTSREPEREYRRIQNSKVSFRLEKLQFGEDFQLTLSIRRSF